MNPEAPSEAPRARWRGAYAFAGAVLVHAAVFAVAARHERANARGAVPDRLRTEFEVDLLAPDPTDERVVDRPPATEGEPVGVQLAGIANRPRGPNRREEPTTPTVATAAPEGTGESPTAPLAPAASGRPGPIDLGLAGGVLRAALLDPTFARREAPPPSVGLLNEGLAQMSAANGLSRSSAAVSAAYQAASAHAPAAGLAVFEVEADASGAVVAVTLVSEGPEYAKWSRVADELRAQLAKRKLRVPQGAAGLLTRLRIERGRYAEDLAAMNRLERGAAVGQGALPPRQAADESTQGSLGRELTPTAQVLSSERSARATRVVIIGERVL